MDGDRTTHLQEEGHTGTAPQRRPTDIKRHPVAAEN